MASTAFAQSFSGGKPHPIGIVLGIFAACFFACYFFKELARRRGIPGWSASVMAALAVVLLGGYSWWLFQPPVVKVIFKPSPIGTPAIGPWRRYRIQLAITKFRNYLSDDVGFQVPNSVPPIGIGKGSGVFGQYSISISSDYISDDREVVAQYSASVFAELFPIRGFSTAVFGKATLAQLYSSYFTDSYFGSIGSYNPPLMQALWEMRSSKLLGPTFVDHSLLAALNPLQADKGQPCPPGTPICEAEDFDKNFVDAFLSGEVSMLFDFAGEADPREALVNDIFRRHGIVVR